MRSLHCTCALAALALAAQAPVAALQQRPPAAPNVGETASSLTIFVRGVPVGSEQSAVTRSADGWTITGSGRIGAPLNVVATRLEVRYDPNWKPLELTLDATVRGQDTTLRTTVNGGTITNRVTTNGQSVVTTAMTEAEVLLPSTFFAPYEALAARLRTAGSGSTIAGYFAPQAPVTIAVGETSSNRFQTATRVIEARRSHVTITPIGVGTSLEIDIWADPNGRLVRLSIPAEGLEVVREDVASVSARHVPISRPNDEQVRIPGNGFSLAGTISKPADSNGKLLPGVVLLGGGPADRDLEVAGVPILGEIAGALADAGFLTLRFDKRGVGQSGGRIESATLADLAEDARAGIKLLAQRMDVDAKRLAVVGHGEGGAVALLAAARDKRISAVGLLAASGIPGSDLILEQQQHLLRRSSLSEAERQDRVDLQKRINQAAIAGKGWDQLPPEARRQADNAEFQSLLAHDPAKILPDVRQRLLILQGELDTEVAPSNADRLEALARKRKNAPAVEVVRLPGVNHLLILAVTGEVDEYTTLSDKHVSSSVSQALVAWLRRTFGAK